MLSQEEMRKSPLFQDISYESYLAMYHCFQAVSRSYRPEEVICDFSGDCSSVGIVERLIRYLLPSTLTYIAPSARWVSQLILFCLSPISPPLSSSKP